MQHRVQEVELEGKKKLVAANDYPQPGHTDTKSH